MGKDGLLGSDEEAALLDARINGDAPIGFSGRRPRACMTCARANGEPPWADSPLKSYCTAFPREAGRRKPPDVYYEGADCALYVEDLNG